MGPVLDPPQSFSETICSEWISEARDKLGEQSERGPVARAQRGVSREAQAGSPGRPTSGRVSPHQGSELEPPRRPPLPSCLAAGPLASLPAYTGIMGVREADTPVPHPGTPSPCFSKNGGTRMVMFKRGSLSYTYSKV